MESAEAKGVNFVACQEMVVRQAGAEALAAALARLPPELAERLRNRAVISAGWYPVAWYDQLLAAVLAALPGSSLATLEQLGYGGVERDMRGVYRLLVKLITPQTMMSWGPRTFGHYYRGGQVKIAAAREDAVTVVYSGWEGFTLRLWHSVMGGSYAALAACGAEQVTGSIAGLEGHGAGCTMRLQWRR